MRYDDDDAAAAAHGLNGTAQGILAVGVEIRIRLIEHDQKRVAEDGSSQCSTSCNASMRHGPAP